MKQILVVSMHFLLGWFSLSEKQSEFKNEIAEEEDQRVLHESIQLFGCPQSAEAFNLPGPQLIRHRLFDVPEEIKFSNNGSGYYSFEYYFKKTNFAYLERYEVGELKKIGNETIQTVRGQFAEKFTRNHGGFYIRTIGYVADENGYQQFLLDISTAVTTYQLIDPIAHLVGIPMGPKIAISSTVLATLTGGNLGIMVNEESAK